MIDDALGLVGRVVAEKYEVLEAVGKGGFSVVYRARHTLWQRTVALKVFIVGDGTRNGQRKIIEDLVREASLLAELSEKTASICQARDVGILETRSGKSLPYLVLEWLSGKSLARTLAEEERAKTPPRSPAAVVSLLEPVAEGLAVAHSSGIAHRDVKPANIFLAADSGPGHVSVKLLDFGIAKVVTDAQRFDKTAGIVTAFTPTHGAPEQFSRTYGATGPWTDVFAFALVLCECVTGQRVVVGSGMAEMASVVMDPARRPTPRVMGAVVSDATEAVFARALAVKPGDRYPTVGAFWVELARSVGVEPSKTISACARLSEAPPLDAPLDTPAPSKASEPQMSPDAPPAQSSGMPRPASRVSGKRVVGVGVMLIVALTVALGVAYRLEHGAVVLPGPQPTGSASAGAN